MEKGTRIIFLQDITCSPTGDHPAYIFAKKGELGTINEKLKNDAYSVYWDGWERAPFIAEPHEFEVYEGKENV